MMIVTTRILVLLIAVLMTSGAPAAPKSLNPPARPQASFPATITVPTTLKGSSATGVLRGDSYRFIVKYASAARWAAPAVSSTWALPNNLKDPAGTPLACPQDGMDASQYAEDCLSMIIYVPKTLAPPAMTNAPIMMWIHGGSFTQGSASDPSIDASKFAAATNTIVAVPQYRLGGFGWMAPNGAANLGLKDVIASLTFLNKVITNFGGASGQVVMAGQSSGATLIRALLAAPSTSSLFKSAILQSDPMDYGFYKPAAQTTLTNNFLAELSCKASDTKCLAGLSVQNILDATDNTFLAGLTGQLDPSVGGGEVFRPVRDGTLITSPLSTSAAFPKQSKPILVTTVIDEATPTIFGFADPQPIAPANYHATVRASYSESSTGTLVNSSFYKLPGGLSANADVRPTVQVMGTDGIWRCPSWTFSRLWSSSGAKAYVGQFVVGATHPDNAGISQCTASGAVCHEDDISIVFGTVSSPSAAQSKAIGEVQARWGAFIKTGNPNAPGYANWSPAGTGDNVGALQLGQNAQTTVSVGACTSAFWGKAVPYDYQIFGI